MAIQQTKEPMSRLRMFILISLWGITPVVVIAYILLMQAFAILDHSDAWTVAGTMLQLPYYSFITFSNLMARGAQNDAMLTVMLSIFLVPLAYLPYILSIVTAIFSWKTLRRYRF